MVESKVAVLESLVSGLRSDLKEVEAKVDELQKLMRWGMGAAAGMGVMMALILPKVGKVLGLS